MCVNGKHVASLANKIQQVKRCRLNFKAMHEVSWEESFRLDRTDAVHYPNKNWAFNINLSPNHLLIFIAHSNIDSSNKLVFISTCVMLFKLDCYFSVE
jgi:hypothetical protein